MTTISKTNANTVTETAVKDLTTKESGITGVTIDVDAEEVNDEAKSGPNTGTKRERVPRERCTCYYCEVDTGEDRQNQHICHVTDCNKVFKKPSLLREHIRLHMGERPYRCTWPNCGKRFTRTDELGRHRRVHTGEKPHECTECDKKFRRTDHLAKHMRCKHNKLKCDYNDLNTLEHLIVTNKKASK